MRERPIICTDVSVRAIISGQKTQTRRVIKPQPAHLFGKSSAPGRKPLGQGYVPAEEVDDSNPDPSISEVTKILRMSGEPTYCPFGCIGDRLWVQEAWCQVFDTPAVLDFRATPFHNCSELYPWMRPSKLDRKHSRILLEIETIAVDKLQDMEHDDFCAEGCRPLAEDNALAVFREARQTFIRCWDAIHQKDGYLWETNPWVWVIAFKVVEAPDLNIIR